MSAVEASGTAAATSATYRDLADEHAPVSDFLSLSDDSWPITDAAIAKYSLSAAQLDGYNRDGFVDGVTVLNAAQVDRLRAELAEIMDPSHPAHKLWHEYNENEAGAASGKVLFHSLGAWRISPAFHDVLFHPGYLVPAAQLMARDRGAAATPEDCKLHLWHDQVFAKPPKTGAVVAWHQDFSYWTRTKPMGHMTVHITLDDQTADNGVLQYVPGSHRWPLLPVTSRHFGDMESITTVLTDDQKAEFARRRAASLKAGQAAFHHPLSVHGSYENRSDAPRRATVVNLFNHGTRSDVDEPLLEGLPAYSKDSVLEGKFFPVLYDRTGTGGAAASGAAGGGAATGNGAAVAPAAGAAATA